MHWKFGVTASAMVVIHALATPRAALSQGSVPPATYPAIVPSPRTLNATAIAFDVESNRRHHIAGVPLNAARVPSDSIRAASVARASTWLQTLRAMPPAGIHLEDAARVALSADQDSLAQAYLAQRLASANLSTLDRAHTLLAGARMFADTARPRRLAIAESYMTQLDRLSIADAGMWVQAAHLAIASAYDVIGQSQAALAHGVRVLQLATAIPFVDRASVFEDPSAYLLVARLLGHTPDGRAQLQNLTTKLQAAAIPPANLVAEDSTIILMGNRWSEALRGITDVVALIGTTAAPIRASAWLNAERLTTTPDSAGTTSLRLNDGIVRVLMFGNYGCCATDLVSMQRLHTALPEGAQAIFVTSTRGYIAYEPAKPDDELKWLGAKYRDELKATLPIALWAGPLKTVDGGGILPAASPNIKAYRVPSNQYGFQDTPYFVVVDGAGIIRHVLYPSGRFVDRRDEAQLEAIVRSLIAASAVAR